MIDDPICFERASIGSPGCIYEERDWCGIGLVCNGELNACEPSTPFGSTCDEYTLCEQSCGNSWRCRPEPDLLLNLFCQ
jgi:hypothetical protein